MYHILIADDEKIERKGILMLLKHIGISCETAEVSNGKQALEYLEEHDIDILLTDVRMPFMDGIELITRLKEAKRNMKFIIFSGCSEFDYARKAVRLGVSDYILKPVDPAEFKETLLKVTKELEAERKEKQVKEAGAAFAHENALYQIIYGADADEVIEKSEGLVSREDICGYKRVMLIEFGQDFFGRDGVDFRERIIDKQKIPCGYLNLNQLQSIVLFKDDSIDFLAAARSLAGWIEEEYKKSCYIAVSSGITDMRDMSKVLDELEGMMESRFYHPSCHVYYKDMDHSDSDIVQIEDDTLIKQMKQDIRIKDIQGLKEHFEIFSRKYENKTAYSQMYIKFLFANLIKDIYSIIPQRDEAQLNNEVDALYHAADFADVKRAVDRDIAELEKLFTHNYPMQHKEIDVVKQYIYDHFGEEISVDKLGELVYMTPSYLSAIFKKETGQNLSRFVKAYRMDKAKELLENSMQKIVDISNACGYPNVSYFCQSFREYFGVSPQRFRESGEEL